MPFQHNSVQYFVTFTDFFVLTLIFLRSEDVESVNQ